MSAAPARAILSPVLIRTAAAVPAAAAVAGSEAASPRSVPAPAYEQAAAKPQKSFTLHIGGNLRLPARPAVAVAADASPSAAATANRRDPFAGLPLAAWADRLGERVMPAWEAAQAEAKAAKAAAAAAGAAAGAAAAPPPAPAVPGFLPFTRWAAASPAVRATLVAPPPKEMPKPRLSWWHPDDAMVPRGWWKQGLLADLQYYKPFTSPQTAAT